jgi:hypothetical protein
LSPHGHTKERGQVVATAICMYSTVFVERGSDEMMGRRIDEKQKG